MQIKNPKTGEVFENILTAMKRFCPANNCTCTSCPISMWNNVYKLKCRDFCVAHPAEAARRMGYMVVADGTDGPQLTDQEIAIMRATGAKWVSRNENSDYGFVEMWQDKPLCVEEDFFSGDGNPPVARVLCTLFPSIRPGDRVCVDDQTGKDT